MREVVHVLVATVRNQLQHLHATLRTRRPDGDTAAERVAPTLMGAFRAPRAPTFADRSAGPPCCSALINWLSGTVEHRLDQGRQVGTGGG